MNVKYFVVFQFAFIKLIDHFTICILKSSISSTFVGSKRVYQFCYTKWDGDRILMPSLLPWTSSVYFVYNSKHIFWGSVFDDFDLPIRIPLRKLKCLFARQIFFSQNIHSIFWRTIWLLLLIWIIMMTNWFHDKIISQFGPCIGITYLKFVSFWIFAWCNKNSLCKSPFLVYTQPLVTNTCPSSVKSHFIITHPLEEEFWNFLIQLRNNSFSRGQVFNGNVYVCTCGLNTRSFLYFWILLQFCIWDKKFWIQIKWPYLFYILRYTPMYDDCVFLFYAAVMSNV